MPVNWKGFGLALLASLLFSLSTPLGKLILDSTAPLALSAYTYLVVGLVFLPSFFVEQKYTPIQRADWKKLGAMILFGSVLAPIALFYGLSQVNAFQAALYLNFEIIFTILLAVLLFHERVGSRGILGTVLIVVLLVGWSIDFDFARLVTVDFNGGLPLVLVACACWGIDNNISTALGERSHYQVTSIKGLCGGAINLLMAVTLRISLWVPVGVIPWIVFVGAVSYGLSIACFLIALKKIGTTKAGTMFSLNPFFGSLIALIIFQIAIRPLDLLVYVLVLGGVLLLLSDQHGHGHYHLAGIHKHPIDIDEHHQPGQIKVLESAEDCGKEDGGVLHEHKEIKHDHEHNHDLHHRHKH